MEHALGRQLIAEDLPVARHLAELEGALDLHEEVVELHRLQQVVPRSRAHRGDRRVHGAERGEHDHRHVRRNLLEMAEERDPVHLRHANVR